MAPDPRTLRFDVEQEQYAGPSRRAPGPWHRTFGAGVLAGMACAGLAVAALAAAGWPRSVGRHGPNLGTRFAGSVVRLPSRPTRDIPIRAGPRSTNRLEVAMSSPAGANPPGGDEGGFAPWDLVGNALRDFFTTPAPPEGRSELYIRSLQSELFGLAAKTAGGTVQLDAVRQARLEQLLLGELPALNPTPEPTKSDLISGEWECLWTTEKEINFVVKNGLLGLPWKRTYQTIDSAAGSLTNVIELENGALTVGSSFLPDEGSNGTRFNFEFKECSLCWRGFTVPLPPVGRGWGEVIYLDEAMRIQRDIRGDVLLAKRVK